jgi:hypothetical protein
VLRSGLRRNLRGGEAGVNVRHYAGPTRKLLASLPWLGPHSCFFAPSAIFMCPRIAQTTFAQLSLSPSAFCSPCPWRLRRRRARARWWLRRRWIRRRRLRWRRRCVEFCGVVVCLGSLWRFMRAHDSAACVLWNGSQGGPALRRVRHRSTAGRGRRGFLVRLTGRCGGVACARLDLLHHLLGCPRFPLAFSCCSRRLRRRLRWWWLRRRRRWLRSVL